MGKSVSKCNDDSHIIKGIEITPDTLTSRGGLSLFVRYVTSMGLWPIIEELFGGLRKSRKGQKVEEIFKQLFCFLVDGTSYHLVRFDALKQDPGYAGAIQSKYDDLLSSHSVKRFFRSFSWGLTWLFRRLMLRLFLWRLHILRPEVVVVGIDTMVMDNDEAIKREGVQWTYKKVKGFQPLQMTWGRFPIDAVFRGGKKHGNSGVVVPQMVRRIVSAIRSGYRSDVAIVFRVDSGFMDQKVFRELEELQVGYTCSGKLYTDIKEYAQCSDNCHWGRYENDNRSWDYLEFGDRRADWDMFRRAIFTRLDDGEDQQLLEFARMESLIYTNLGMGEQIDELLERADLVQWLEADGIVGLHHGRGRDELVHRGIKEFAPESLPFRRFSCNTGFYYTMLLAFFLFECFKEDVCDEVVPVVAYPNTVRRKVIDVAAKIVRSGGKTILKMTQAAWNELNLPRLWERSGKVHRLSSA
jgi:hypothetical protein